MIRSGIQVCLHPGNDRVRVADGRDRVDEVVAQVGDVVVTETHSAHVRGVPADTQQEAQRPAHGLPATVHVGVQHDRLVHHQRRVRPEDLPGPCGGARRHQHHDGTRRPLAGELQLARSERRDEPATGRHRYACRVQLVEERAQPGQRPSLPLGSTEAGDEPRRLAVVQEVDEVGDIRDAVQVQRDDPRGDRRLLRRAQQLDQGLQRLELPTGQPQRGEAQALRLGGLLEVGTVVRNVQHQTQRPQLELTHQQLPRRRGRWPPVMSCPTLKPQPNLRSTLRTG